jgi:hypothetical protein
LKPAVGDSKKKLNKIDRAEAAFVRCAAAISLLLRELFGFAVINPTSNGV